MCQWTVFGTKRTKHFFIENVARNGLKSNFLAQKVLHSAVRTPICQIVPVSRVYGGAGGRRFLPPIFVQKLFAWRKISWTNWLIDVSVFLQKMIFFKKWKARKICWNGPSAEMCRGFLLYKLWRIFPGIFLEDFSGHFFPQKRGEKIRRQNPRKKSGGPKIKIREKSVLPKTDPKICLVFFFFLTRQSRDSNRSTTKMQSPTAAQQIFVLGGHDIYR